MKVLDEIFFDEIKFGEILLDNDKVVYVNNITPETSDLTSIRREAERSSYPDRERHFKNILSRMVKYQRDIDLLKILNI